MQDDETDDDAARYSSQIRFFNRSKYEARNAGL
jgi:hypothetical protein